MPRFSQNSANHTPCTGSRSRNCGDHAAISSAMRCNSASLKTKGMRARLTNSALPSVRCAWDIQTVGQVNPLHAGEVSVARRASGCLSKTCATTLFNRSARSSCSFHQPRPKITGKRSSDVPDVCSNSTSCAASNSSSERLLERKFCGKPARISRLVIMGNAAKSNPARASVSRYSGTSRRRGSNSSIRFACAAS